VFGGELDYQRYGWFDRAAIRFIMRLTGGRPDPMTKAVFTNWDEVERFAGRIAKLATATESRSPG
jgi:menaquinone-dependent protoporphyrinogen oxidase